MRRGEGERTTKLRGETPRGCRGPVHRHRTWACESAGEFGVPDVAKQLSLLRNDQDGHVRHAAKKALSAIGSVQRAVRAVPPHSWISIPRCRSPKMTRAALRASADTAAATAWRKS